ncbi:MAG: ferrous iron transport protein B [Bacteroidales bacterium]|nr:ferrous iron transport protein B [Bacteroidales bacterium]
MRLSDLKTGEYAAITSVKGRGAFRRRIMEMGFIRGKQIKVIKNAPLKDPIEYSLMNYRISLRRSEAELIEVESLNGTLPGAVAHNTAEDASTRIKPALYKGKIINVAFLGNPNAGKTSLFNFASRSHEHTGNYSGVTIDSKTATLEHAGYLFKITDLPGTYSISAYSPEELYVRDYIINDIPDVIVNVVDVSNLERNLYLTTQLIDMDVKVVLALNMYDELEKRKDKLDFVMLAKLLGIPIVPTVGSKGKGIRELLQKIINIYNDNDPFQRHIHINYGAELEESILKIQNLIKVPGNYYITDKVSSRFIALKLLDHDKHIERYLVNAENYNEILDRANKERGRIKLLLAEDAATCITAKKYGFINGALHETFYESEKKKFEKTEVLDSLLTHKLFGFPFFILFMWAMFSATFKLGAYPQQWIEDGVTYLGKWLSDIMVDGSLKDLLIDGVIGGVGGVIVFLPNILILFLFISFMEDSGYMARAVFIMDKVMHKIGLHGKSFIPLIMGFGCNVPAIMATRAIEDRNNRLLTMLINPFMSCSARLPVYLLLIGAIFPAYQGTFLFLLYLTGVILAVLVALFFKRFLFRSEGTPFVMELPPYRMPTFRSAFKHMWFKGSQYLKKMGGVILVASVLLWALGYFPRRLPDNVDTITIQKMDISAESDINSTKILSQNYSEERISKLSKETAQLENSYIGRLGKLIEPVIRPLGFDWKMGVSLITGVAAKEIVVSTLGVLHQVESTDKRQEQGLTKKIQNETYITGPLKGKKVFNPVSTISFLLFILIYFPCIAVFAAVKKESGNIGWAFFMMFYTTALAYLISFTFYQLGSLIVN